MATIPSNRVAEVMLAHAEDIGDSIIDGLAAEAVRSLKTDAPRRTGGLAASVTTRPRRGRVLVVVRRYGIMLDRWKKTHANWMKRTRDRVNAELVRIAGRGGRP